MNLTQLRVNYHFAIYTVNKAKTLKHKKLL